MKTGLDGRVRVGLAPIQRSSLTRQVADKVRSYIFTNNLKVGDELPTEEELAAQLNVSRNTIRHALKALDFGGLIVSRPRVGTRVREFSYDTVVDVLIAHFHLNGTPFFAMTQARCVLERASLPLILEAVGHQSLERLRELEREFEAAVKKEKGYAEVDELFHAALTELTENPVLVALNRLTQSFFHHPRHEKMLQARKMTAEIQEATIREHRELLDAIEARDLRRAERILDQHFERKLRLVADAEHKASEAGESPAA